jgi:hypothetical protein
MFGRDAANPGDALGRILGRTLAQRIEADGVPRDVIVIDQIVGDQHVHHAERERRVGSRQQRDVLVTLLRGLAAVRDRSRSGVRRGALLPARASTGAGWR